MQTELTLGRLADYIFGLSRPYRARLTVVGVMLLTVMGLALCVPLSAGWLIDALTRAPPAASDEAWRALAALILAGLAHQGLRDIATRIWARYQVMVMQQIGETAFARVQRFSTDWHANAFAGATVRRITRGMRAFEQLSDALYFGVVPAALMILGGSLVIALKWPIVGLVFGGIATLFVGVSILLSVTYVGPAHDRANAADSRLGGAFADALGCNATVKAFGAETREDARLSEAVTTWRVAELRAWLRAIDSSHLQVAIMVVLRASVIGLAVWLWLRGQASAGEVTFVITASMMLDGYLRDIGMHIRHLQNAYSEIEDVVAFAGASPAIVDRPHATKLRVSRGGIRFDRVTFRYGSRAEPLYRDFDLTIAPGETIALVGPSGSGKSTFVKLLQRLYDVQDGQILIDGQNIAAVTQESLRQAIALVPQEPVLFHRSLAENIAYGRPGASPADIVAAARMAHAHHFITALPDGYDTLVGERGVKLSGGERQRVAIARAMLADAPILVLDEATAALDSASEALVQDAVNRLLQGRTTILIAHRLSTVRRADRILVFDGGRIVEQGSHEALLARANGRYAHLYRLQAGGVDPLLAKPAA